MENIKSGSPHQSCKETTLAVLSGWLQIKGLMEAQVKFLKSLKGSDPLLQKMHESLCNECEKINAAINPEVLSHLQTVILPHEEVRKDLPLY
jgi:hypothetical protein